MRFRLRALMIVLAGAALFLGGYQLGLRHGRQATTEQLKDRLTKILKSKNSWDDLHNAESPPAEQADDLFAPR